MSNPVQFVCTIGHLPCEAQSAWEKVCFYEHIATKPSWLLRTVLPVPARTSGAYGKVGDVSRCLYSDGGYLTKQIVRIVAGRRIEFDIIEQSIRYAGRIVLKGGYIEIESHADGTSSVRMVTRYQRHRAARWIPRYFIDRIVKAMHEIVIQDMQTQLRPAPLRAFEVPGANVPSSQ